jgi:hypothetical protein
MLHTLLLLLLLLAPAGCHWWQCVAAEAAPTMTAEVELLNTLLLLLLLLLVPAGGHWWWCVAAEVAPHK